jgi:hypothetical protein
VLPRSSERVRTVLTSRMLSAIATPFASLMRSPQRELPANS